MVGTVRVDSNGADSTVVQIGASGNTYTFQRSHPTEENQTMKKMTVGFAAPALLAVALGTVVTACNNAPPTSPARSYSGTGSVAATATALRATVAEDVELPRGQVFEGAGDITASLAAFRSALGDLNPNQPGSFGAGRREINWDAVPPLFTNVDNFPADFFNQPAVGRARGAVFSTPGTGFRVSDQNFADLNPTYGDEFKFFSPVRTFIAVGDERTGVDFFVPGSNTPATTAGFGVVFSDLDRVGSGKVRFFDAAGHDLGTYLAPPSPGGFSFLGVRFPDRVVARVEIISGHGALGADSFDASSEHRGPTRDLAIMDDFLYGEPVAIEAQTTTTERAGTPR